MIKSRAGYEIPCLHTITGTEKKAVLIMHGFGSSKESFTAQMLAEHFPKAGIGTFAFDFPAHGESPAAGEQLTLTNCLADMERAESELRRLAPEAEIGYFGSSFGAYMTLLYLASAADEGRAFGKKAFLRSAAVEMPLLLANKTPEGAKLLAEQGYLMADEDYLRPLKLTQEFFDELDANDVFQRYRAGTAELAMVHGTGDDTASPEAARRFAAQAEAQITMIRGGDHQLSLPGMPQQVVELAASFFGEAEESACF